MGIDVQPEALSPVARAYQDASTAVITIRTGLSRAADQAVAAAAHPQVTAGVAAFRSGLDAALQALTERAGRYGSKVDNAAAGYQRTEDSISQRIAGQLGTTTIARSATPAAAPAS